MQKKGKGETKGNKSKSKRKEQTTIGKKMKTYFTVSSPTFHAKSLVALDLKEGQTVLDVGFGGGHMVLRGDSYLCG